MSAPWRRLCSAWMVSLSCHHRQLLLHRSVGLDRISSQVRGTEDSGRWSPTPPKLQKKHLQQQSSCVLYQKLSRMCVVFPKKQYLVSSICTAEPRVCVCVHPRSPAAQECVCCFSITVVLLQMLSDAKMLAFLKGTPNLFCFFYMVLYEEKNEACSIHKSNI